MFKFLNCVQKICFPLETPFFFYHNQTTLTGPYSFNRNKILVTSIHIVSMHHKKDNY